ncbi:fatty acid desaturase-domain-containing protein [Schizophyllum amplum]|uniref:Delta 8-(E)-sphingolipid desaturase n=1 Tax=Schizophyllum amplum TaxID=97359 RepID=A0A550C5Y6_9AGAR|nr:fatty acid desaturase-domain-containing protein [Auriculariopsis ampla]
MVAIRAAAKSLPIIPRVEVGKRILVGEPILIYHGLVLRVPPSWLAAHPGGEISILHYVGRDCTDEVDAFHPDDVCETIRKYAVGAVDDSDLPWHPYVPPVMTGWVRRRAHNGDWSWYREADMLVGDGDADSLFPSSQILLVERDTFDAVRSAAPPEKGAAAASEGPTLELLTPGPASGLSAEIQARHSRAWHELQRRIDDAGLFQCKYLRGYGPEVLRYALLSGVSAWCYSAGYFFFSALFLGLFWQQLVFAAHDLGHASVTHVWEIDRIISILIADFIGGLSIGWWVENHNVHHLITNHPSHDPDIQHLPFFAISPVFFKNLFSSYYKRMLYFDAFAKIFVSIQHKLFYVVMAFARFNLYALSYGHLWKKAFDTRRTKGGRWAWGLECVGIVFFWYWFGNVLRGCGSWQKALMFLVVSHAATSPLHIQIVLSHFSMSTVDLGPLESFAARQMRTTTDVLCPRKIGFIHGGLHLQVTHHLFPRLPRHNLDDAAFLVKEFAKEQGLVYAEFGFIAGNQDVLGTLRNVAEQVKVIGQVASAEAKEALDKKLKASEKDCEKLEKTI